jgi:hypothetical protein
MPHALLAIALPLALACPVAFLACGDDRAPSGDAGIADIRVSAGELSPPFSRGVEDYAVDGVLSDSLGVTVTLADSGARLTINGAAAASGRRADVALRDGRNDISVLVTAGGGATSQATLSVDRPALNTSVVVVNGMGGAPLENTVVTLADGGGRVLAGDVPLPREKNGAPFLALDRGQKYSIYATGTAGAMSCLSNFDPAMEDTAALICLRTNSTYYEYEAPIIEEIAFAQSNSAGADWNVMPNEARYEGPLADVAAVRVSILTRNLIAGSTSASSSTMGSVPMRVMLDQTASPNIAPVQGAAGTLIGDRNDPTDIGGRRYYRSVYRAAVPLITASVFNKEHFLSVVAYDCNGNRTEQRVYMTITDSINDVDGDADLSAVAPLWRSAQGQTYVGGGDMAAGPGQGEGQGGGQGEGGATANAMDPPDYFNGYQQAILEFYVRAPGSTANTSVRGYEVWRSIGGDGDGGFARIATVNFAAPAQGTPFSYTDRSATLAAGDVYYRIRAFGGNPANDGFSLFSPSALAKVMPPSAARPAASHKTVSDWLWPEFRIAATNPAMLNWDAADRFVFMLFVKDAYGPDPVMAVPFRVMFDESDLLFDPDAQDLAYLPESDPRNAHRYGFQPGRPTVQYLSGFTYNTSTGGISGGTWLYASDYYESTGQRWPFAYLDYDGSVVVNTGTPECRKAIDNQVRSGNGVVGEPFRPGYAYLWNIFGSQGGLYWANGGYPANLTSNTNTNAAHFTKGWNADGATPLGYAFGSHQQYGFGAPEGWFTIAIAPDAF